MADIGEAVGLRKASLYNHLSTKHDMLRELVERGAALFTDGMAPIVASSAPAVDRLGRAMRMHLRVVADHPDVAIVFLQEWRQLEEEARLRVCQSRDRYEAAWRSIIADGVREGRFRPDLDIRFAALTLLSAANWAYQWYDPQGPLTSDQVADRFVALALNGMAYDEGKQASVRPAASSGQDPGSDNFEVAAVRRDIP
jgi:AcrR family transcriptional regulator